MSCTTENEKGTTRREFVKIAAGAAVAAAASGLKTSAVHSAEVGRGIIGPKNGKFAKYVKPINYQDPGWGSIRPWARMDSAFLEGENLTIDMGTVVYAGKMGKEPYEAHVHDYDQVIYMLGGDCYSMGDLYAEVELCLGKEKEVQQINSTTAVYVPRGMPHFPLTVRKMNKRFYYIEISLAREYKETPVAGEPGPQKVAGMISKYRSNLTRPPFQRKTPGIMNPDSKDDSGGALAGIRNDLFPTVIMCESLINSPYRFPNPDYHIHTEPEFIIFHGSDPDNPTELGGEVELYLGAKGEAERYIVTVPTVWIVPANLPHCPLIVTKVDKPFIFTDIRPYGVENAPGKKG